MAYYRLYVLDPRSNRIMGFEEFEAVSDDAAMIQAEQKRGARPLELWSGCKRIHRVSSLGESAAPSRTILKLRTQPSG
jgi:hypothetical protein